jgi:predicted GNAT family acetyltransferase
MQNPKHIYIPSTMFPPNFENRGVSNNFVEHRVHNEIEMIGYMVKRVEGRA